MEGAAADRDERVATIVERLEAEYPDATISLEFSNRLELLVAVVLSAQCTDERVNQVTDDLFERYDSVDAFAEADQDELAEAIGSITYPNSKAEYIRESSRRIRDEHGGEVPATMAELTDLPGIGRKTANVILQHGHDIRDGVVVDTHVQRLTRRLGITEAKSPEAIEQELMALLPREQWQEYTHLLISHGRAVCTARNPSCGECVLEDRCPSSRLRHDVDLASGERWDER